MANNGRLYEKFVADLQQALIDSQMLMQTKQIKIEQNRIESLFMNFFLRFYKRP